MITMIAAILRSFESLIVKDQQNHTIITLHRVIHLRLFNPISAGVLENQDMLGGSQFDPPLNPMFDVQI